MSSVETIVLTSDSNGMTIYITPVKSEHTQKIKEVATKAYDYWFACDDPYDPAYYDATGSYVQNKLSEFGFLDGMDYSMAFGNDWEEEGKEAL